jgi:uncharacterized protein YqhQ
MNKNTSNNSCRLGSVGGQAVLEGVMMKSGDRVALSVRAMNGTITTETSSFTSVRKKHKILDLPLIRGVVNFVESMILSTKILNRSADLLGIEEEESKFEKWLSQKLGKSAAAIASVIGTVLGLALSVVLFMYLPALISDFTDRFCDAQLFKSAVEGVTKILIFILYIVLVGLIPDMKRVFQYHGAEHKSIFCHESGDELTVENVMKQSRFHPRCGTSFLFVMMFISIFISVIYIGLPRLPRVLIKLVMLPLIVGIGYEFIKFAGTHNNIFIRILSAPGLWVQRLTTKEPDAKQIEVAIASLKASLPDIYPEGNNESCLKADDGAANTEENNTNAEQENL